MIIDGFTFRATGRICLRRVDEGTRQTLLTIISNKLRDGTHIISDGWAAYQRVRQSIFKYMPFQHTTTSKNGLHKVNILMITKLDE